VAAPFVADRAGTVVSGYSEMYHAQERAAFLKRWCPETSDNGLVEVTEANLRYNIARARAAESELQGIKSALYVLRQAERR